MSYPSPYLHAIVGFLSRAIACIMFPSSHAVGVSQRKFRENRFFSCIEVAAPGRCGAARLSHASCAVMLPLSDDLIVIGEQNNVAPHTRMDVGNC